MWVGGLRGTVDLRFCDDGYLDVLLRNTWVVDDHFKPTVDQWFASAGHLVEPRGHARFLATVTALNTVESGFLPHDDTTCLNRIAGLSDVGRLQSFTWGGKIAADAGSATLLPGLESQKSGITGGTIGKANTGGGV